MAIQIQVAGLVTVKLDTGTDNALEDLGYNVNQTEITDRGYYVPVFSDQHGGSEGPPIDQQFMGRTAEIRVELSKWDSAVWDKALSRLNSQGSSEGTVPTSDIGSLVIQDSEAFRVVLLSSNAPYNFPLCRIVDQHTLTLGTKHSILQITFEAMRNPSSGVLYNSTTS